MTHAQEKKESMETDQERTWRLKLAETNFKARV